MSDLQSVPSPVEDAELAECRHNWRYMYDAWGADAGNPPDTIDYEIYRCSKCGEYEDRQKQRCDTTLTERRPREDCVCDTEQDALGPCDTWCRGADGNCAYCVHAEVCHLTDAEVMAWAEVVAR